MAINKKMIYVLCNTSYTVYIHTYNTIQYNTYNTYNTYNIDKLKTTNRRLFERDFLKKQLGG